MSMRMLTIIQLIWIAAIYFGMTVAVPAVVFHKRMQTERFCVRILAYYVMGNFYLMNLVFALQLLHISNRYTLIFFTVVPVVLAAIRLNGLDVKEMVLQVVQTAKRFFEGSLGFKLLLSNLGKAVKGGLRKLVHRFTDNFFREFFNRVLTVAVILLILWLFGTNAVTNYGYCASDIPVHNYWINELGKKNLFAAGVYPQGFHCIIYYVHAVFGVETFVLLRLFCLIQSLVVHLVLLIFLKTLCRTRYAPYLAFVFYTLGNFWNRDVLARFYASLPQEFGMIFILPAALFLILFFPDRKQEQGKKGIRVHSTRYLVWFAMSFSMTLAAHFYNTMIIGIFCVGIAVGFLGLLFRKAYFGRIMLAGIISIVVAVLPMGIAFATGTPMEGSLRWGLSIINSSSSNASSNENAATGTNSGADAGTSTDAAGDAASSTAASPGGDGASDQSGNLGEGHIGNSAIVAPQAPKPSLQERIAEKWVKVERLCQGLRSTVGVYVLNRMEPEQVAGVLLTVPITGVLGMLYLLSKRNRYYGCILISVASFMMFMYVMLMAGWFGLPSLMDSSRCSIYLAYGLAMSFAFCVDAIISFLLGWIPATIIMNSAALAGVIVMVAIIIKNDKVKEPFTSGALETNGAIICLTNILREEPNWMFTVCSANDELRMVEDYGYHYEMINFLRDMEGKKADDYLTIPTPRIYFFIEKIPGDYTMSYYGSGRVVSEEGADRPLPGGVGLDMYKGESRYIVMSRMYYWAEAFRKLYPSEMRTYFETDDFICYVLEQNTYRLYDLSIDYGYNQR